MAVKPVTRYLEKQCGNECPTVVANTCERHFGSIKKALAYCKELGSYDGPLSHIYQQAADILSKRAQTVPCNLCQDRPGYDGLGRTCKGCWGTGWVLEK